MSRKSTFVFSAGRAKPAAAVEVRNIKSRTTLAGVTASTEAKTGNGHALKNEGKNGSCGKKKN